MKCGVRRSLWCEKWTHVKTKQTYNTKKAQNLTRTPEPLMVRRLQASTSPSATGKTPDKSQASDTDLTGYLVVAIVWSRAAREQNEQNVCGVCMRVAQEVAKCRVQAPTPREPGSVPGVSLRKFRLKREPR